MIEIQPALYMLPVGMSDAAPDTVLPHGNMEIMDSIRHFIVENVRTARRFLRSCNRHADIDAMTFYELNGHTDPMEISRFLDPLRKGIPMGMMSEAGCPGIADPGAAVACIAQREGLRVIPLAGPSSIVMSLMASGFNGQGFTFHGYLPVDSDSRTKAIKALERESKTSGRTQIFIETPYRNAKMLDSLCEVLSPETSLCVAEAITDPQLERIVTKKVSQWRAVLKKNQYFTGKNPAIFLIGKTL